MTAEQERQVALLLKDQILTRTDRPIRQIILYGSRAQGMGHPDSDFDLLVVAADPVVKRDERQRLRSYLTDVPYEVMCGSWGRWSSRKPKRSSEAWRFRRINTGWFCMRHPEQVIADFVQQWLKKANLDLQAARLLSAQSWQQPWLNGLKRRYSEGSPNGHKIVDSWPP